jgi:hypothetical protein
MGVQVLTKIDNDSDVPNCVLTLALLPNAKKVDPEVDRPLPGLY